MERFRHIRDNIEAARSFVAGMTLDAFRRDRKTLYAVVRALEIISEASRHIPATFKQAHPEVAWQAIAAAGNVYRHEYPRVTEAVIWNTVQNELEALDKAVRAEIARSEIDPPER